MWVLDDPEELETMARALGGAPAQWGEYETWGHKEAMTIELLAQIGEGRGRGVKHTFVYPTAKLPGLEAEETLTVAGETFEVRDVLQMGDGALSRALLALPRGNAGGG